MPVFLKDWGGVIRQTWPALLQEFTGKPGLRFLEIGCFEGRTTLWLLENVLTHPSSRITVVDTFEGSPEFPADLVPFEDRFLANIQPYAERVTVHKGKSQDIIPTLRGRFDFVFVDGSHKAEDVWADALAVWPLVRRDGLVAFDDYLWHDGGPSTPKPALDRLIDEVPNLSVEHLDYQLIARKL